MKNLLKAICYLIVSAATAVELPYWAGKLLIKSHQIYLDKVTPSVFFTWLFGILGMIVVIVTMLILTGIIFAIKDKLDAKDDERIAEIEKKLME